jgi:D-inositol-3-phosphate glycosyltransferase
MKISLLTGGDDPNYAFPLSSSLSSQGIEVDFIGNDEMQQAEIINNKNINYLNLRGDQSENTPIQKKVFRLLRYYLKLITYAAKTDSRLFHILWLNKFIYFDRTFLNIYYKMLGKTLVFTAHNVNAGERDGDDNSLNRLTLKFLYKIVDHIFVHTMIMKQQLVEDFDIDEDKITVISFGINRFIPRSVLSSRQATEKLNLAANTKTILFFGRIAPYKGLSYLVSALANLKRKGDDFKLIIAGKLQRNCDQYWKDIEQIIEEYDLEDLIIRKVHFIPDEDIEIYFKAADVLILPYKHIFQSGPLFMSYNFGLPVIASDVGSFREDVIEGETGYICKAEDPVDLAAKIEMYFQSDLFKNLETNREKIMKFANEKYSWETVGQKTYEIYRRLQNS